MYGYENVRLKKKKILIIKNINKILFYERLSLILKFYIVFKLFNKL